MINYPEIDITQVDFNDTRDIEGFAIMIFTMANRLRLFMPAAGNTPEKTELQKCAKTWIGRVEDNIPALSAGDSLTIIGVYDLVHRIAFNRAANGNYLNKYKLNAFDAYLRGDKTVNQYALQQVVSLEIRRGNKVFMDKPLQWECRCLDRWHKQFRLGKSLDQISDYDTIQRVKSLLDSDLWAFETRNESSFKQKLFDNHRHYFDETERLDITALTALDSFLCSSARYLTPDEFYSYEESIYRSLLHNPDTNRYLKASIQLRLEDTLACRPAAIS